MSWFPLLRGKSTAAGEGKSYGYASSAGAWDSTYGLAGRLRSRRRTWPVERAVAEAYERSIWMYKGIDTIGNKVMDRRFEYRYPGSEKVVDDHPMYRLLNGPKANALESGPALRKRIAAQFLLSERGVFVEAPLTRAGDVSRLELLPPGRTKPVPTRDEKMIDRFETTTLDGSVRAVPVEHVRWIRNPHPLDPYASSIPITAAGLSVEMDDLGRLVNVTWMSNDGQTRAIIAVKGDMNNTDSGKLERRFGSGPVDAGKVSVVTADGLAYIDLSAHPRDMQYENLAKNAKIETLAALGVPESQLGNAAERTYANAEAEGYMFWSITMASILRLIAVAFYDPEDEDLEPWFNTEDVPELQLPQRTRRLEAREEVAAGLRSIKSYAELAGITVVSTPETEALWLPQGKTPLDQSPGAAKRVQLPAAPTEEQAAPQEAAEGGETDGEPQRGQPGKPVPGQSQPGAGKPPAPPKPTGPAKPTAATARTADGGGESPAGPQSKVRAPYTIRRKGLPPTRRHPVDVRQVKAAADALLDWSHSDVDGSAQDQAEALVAAALAGLATRWVERTVARLQSPKTRKGTRHWQPDPTMPADTRVGRKALNAEQAVDPDTWRREAEAAVGPLLASAGAAAAGAMGVTLTGQAPVDEPSGGTGAVLAAGAVTSATAAAVSTVAAAVGVAAGNAAAQLAARISQFDADGLTLDDMVAQVRGWDVAGWARRLAATAAPAALEAGRYAAGKLLAQLGWEVVATWRTRADNLVRSSHADVDGQVRKVGQTFAVGDAALRFPRDPLGPAQEVIGCRCQSRWSARRFTPAPAVPA
ncbi:phage portal protein [Micromonospora lupini]|uniref:phage portal protein n=1 Tax=Micromonospora lupini TaxID=285679 RepID=UPI00225421DD|nr:phage portal protein [Micromonospora lupini]MCX5070817.1 phage portal protein [Micromonospora lupini]